MAIAAANPMPRLAPVINTLLPSILAWMLQEVWTLRGGIARFPKEALLHPKNAREPLWGFT